MKNEKQLIFLLAVGLVLAIHVAGAALYLIHRTIFN